MALDTQQKRMSAVGAGRPWLRSSFPATIDAAWRLSVGNVYSGNAVAGAPSNTEIEQARGLHRFVFSRVHGRVN